ncbi:MAG: transposase [Bacteroidales bacterium]|nr:transposase [Bacteroidales bacterium]
MDNQPITAQSLGNHYNIDGSTLEKQYKEHLSDYCNWEQKEHAEHWILFPDNIGPMLSIDETSLSNGELYTILTNKAAKGKKGALVAMVKGTKAEDVIEILKNIPFKFRQKVTEVTMDMANSMNRIVKRCFPNAVKVIDRFHVQKLAYQALQDIRIKHRWEAINAETDAIQNARADKKEYKPITLKNGDTLKELLFRSRYLLFKSPDKWSDSQRERANILFDFYPDIKKAYWLIHKLRVIYNSTKEKGVAYTKLAHWFNEVTDFKKFEFDTVTGTLYSHYPEVLNFFDNRSTNASAESFNAKIKAFRAQLRGVADVKFFLYRLSKIYA